MKSIAIVGSESLLGRDVREVFSAQSLHFDLRQIASTGGGVFGNLDDEAELYSELNADSLEEVDAILLAGTPASSRKAYRIAREIGSTAPVFDLGATLEEDPAARLIAPLTGLRVPSSSTDGGPGLYLVAHAASTALAMLLKRLHAISPMRQTIVTAFEPASERGQGGLDELQQQSSSLLSFREMPQDIYDAQLAFNLLPRYGSEAVINLEDIEALVDRHLASLLGGLTPMPSLRLVQAPVFHGHSFALWVKLSETLEPAVLGTRLKDDLVDMRLSDEEHPNNVGVAGQSGITVGSIEIDRNDPQALWIWMVADGFRLTTENALLGVGQVLR